MKKIIVFLLVLIFIISICSCNSEQNTSNTLDGVYEIDTESYTTESLNHKNVISDSIKYSTDENAATTKTVNICGTEYELTYKDTVTYVVGERSLNRYTVNENDEILLSKNGGISAILFEFAKINRTKNSTPEELLPLLKNELNKVINISQYKEVRLPEPVPENQEGAIIDFLFYNEKYGIITDYALVSVNGNGGVFALKTRDFDDSLITVEPSKSNLEEILELKLSDMYTTEEITYKSYEIFETPVFTVYNGKVFASYNVFATYIHKDRGEESDWLIRILVPTDLS